MWMERIPCERHVIVSFLWLTGSWFCCNVNYCYNLKSAIRDGCIFWGKVQHLSWLFLWVCCKEDLDLLQWWVVTGIPGFGGKRFRNLIGLCLYSMAAFFLPPGDHSTSVWTISLSLQKPLVADLFTQVNKKFNCIKMKDEIGVACK